MTRAVHPESNLIRERRVAILCAGLIALITGFAWLWPQAPTIPPAARIVDPPPAFASSQAFEAANDLAVLRAVLEQQCSSDGYRVMSSLPDKHTGARSEPWPGKFPDGLECAGVRIVDDQQIEAVFATPYHGEVDTMHQGGWGSFYQAFPGATGMLDLSLPTYPTPTSAVVQLARIGCFMCGAGWEVRLVKANGKWRVVDDRPTWVS